MNERSYTVESRSLAVEKGSHTYFFKECIATREMGRGEEEVSYLRLNAGK